MGTEALLPTSNRVVRVLLVDDDPTVRLALRQAIGREPRLAVAAEAAGAEDALALVDSATPDVVVVDADMPQVDGLTATLRIRAAHPDLPVIVLGTRSDDDLALLALRAGATGFLGKDVPPEAIARAVCSVGHGEAAVSRRLTRRLVDELRCLSRRRRGMRPVESRLTPREWQVLDLLAQGASTDDIADRLVLSLDTVRSHIKHVLRKLDAHSRAEAVAAAARMRVSGEQDAGLAELDEYELGRRLEELGVRRRPR